MFPSLPSGPRGVAGLALALAVTVPSSASLSAQMSERGTEGSTANLASADTLLTPELSLTLRQPTDLAFSPDGTRLAFVVTEPPEGTDRERHIWMLEVGEGEVHQFTHSDKSESSPRWSPDGTRLAFTSSRDGTNRLYLIRTDGGEAWPVTLGSWSVGSFAWSPDGNRIAFLAGDTTTAEEKARRDRKDDARVVDKDDELRRLWLLDPASREVRPVTDPSWEIGEFVWNATGDGVYASATDRPASDEITERIVSVALADGSLKELTKPSGSFHGLRLSPDGRTLHWVGCRVDGPTPQDLMAMPVDGGPVTNLTAESLDRPVGDVEWTPGGDLLALVAFGFQRRLTGLRTDGARRDVAMPDDPSSVSGFAVSATGAVAFVGLSATQAPELYVMESGRERATRVSDFNPTWASLRLGELKRFRYASFDGMEMEGALLTPRGWDGISPLPMVTLVHGGPTGMWRDEIDSWGQLLITHGFAVFYPNPRGSTGYGQAFMEANRGDWGGGDFKDIMVGIDTLVARGVADPDRLGIGGWSYGGYMSEWAITQTDRFKAAFTGAGMANLISEFGTEAGSAYDEWFYGLPWEHPEGFLRSSPFMYLKHAHTPTLILHGEDDLTDPLGQSQELYRGLKRYGVEAEFVVYPREGHGLREEQHLLDRLRRIVAWYDRWLK